MAQPWSRRAVELLIAESSNANNHARFTEARAAAVLDRYAALMDAAAGGTRHRAEAEQRRHRLADAAG
jgi:hypothetical protein